METTYEKLDAFIHGDASSFIRMDVTERSGLYFMFLAARAGKRFRDTGDADLIKDALRTFIQLCGLSRQQANAVLKSIMIDMALKGSVS